MKIEVMEPLKYSRTTDEWLILTPIHLRFQILKGISPGSKLILSAGFPKPPEGFPVSTSSMISKRQIPVIPSYFKKATFPESHGWQSAK